MDGNSGDQSTPEANAGARPTQEGTVQRIIVSIYLANS